MATTLLRKLTIISFFVWGSIIGNCFAQNEANIWYFGQYAGLDFNSGSPVALTDGALYTREGCATISDQNGNLLFYTDGVTVWNKLHQVMENGTGLRGHFSSSQSALIVRKPGVDSLYYIFTAGLEQGVYPPNYNDTLNYSIVNINANNGLGKLISKNAPLCYPVTEQLGGCIHANGTDVWIITHRLDSPEYCSYLLTPSGINAIPVVSSIGSSHGDHERGCLKVSPFGTYINCAVEPRQYELFNFNNETGVLSNPIVFTGYSLSYGSAFSPDESKLYIADGDELFQVNLLAGSPTDIINSAISVGNTDVDYFMTMQVAPDQKIYCTVFSHSYLGVINNPNVLGPSCNYADDGIYLEGATAEAGLPNFVSVYYLPSIAYQNNCFGDSTYFTFSFLDSTQTISWDFGDTASGINNSSTLQNPAHLFSGINSYSVIATVITNTIANIYATNIEISGGPENPIFISGTDTICQGTNMVLYEIASIPNADYIIWNLTPGNAGSIIGSDTIVYVNFASSFYGQAILSASGINDCGPGDSAIYIIDVIGNPIANAGSSAIICQNTNHTLGGSALNHGTAIWTTTGDGSFDDPFLLNAKYTPGPDDIENGDVYLILHAFAIDPCIYADADTMLLTFRKLANKPQTPIGPTHVIIEPGLTSEYHTNSVGYANEYLWHLNPIESGIITGSDTTAMVYWNDVYSGTLAFINVDAINDCGGVSSDTLTINLSPVALEEVSLHADEISIRPNPSDGIFNIDIISKVDEIDLRVINSTGINIKHYKINLKGDDNTFKIDLRNQLSGIYYLHFSFHGNSLVKKVLVNHNH